MEKELNKIHLLSIHQNINDEGTGTEDDPI